MDVVSLGMLRSHKVKRVCILQTLFTIMGSSSEGMCILTY